MVGDREEAAELTRQATALALESGSREAFAWSKVIAGDCGLEGDDYEAAEASLREAMTAFEELGAAGRVGWAASRLGVLELKRGDDTRAEKILRDAVRRLRATQEHGFLVEAERLLAEALLRVGNLAEAERLAEHARTSVGREDVWSRASTLKTVALVRVAQDRTAEAEALLREALAIIEPTMYGTLAAEVRGAIEALHHGAAATERR